MSLIEDRSCGCGPAPHPAPPDIPAGLTSLAERQAAGFPEYREAMLAAIPAKPALAGWRARGEADLGVMLLEAWAYVLDVTGFYDARTAERAYIGTAADQAGAQRLAALLGHRARGTMAARLKVALEADGADPVPIPKGVAFRSDAFDDQPPQVFEVDAATTIWPQRNRWRLAPVRGGTFDGVLRFLPRGAPPAGSVILVASASGSAAARVVAVEPETGQDGAAYARLVLESGASVAALAGSALATMSVMILRLPLAPNSFGTASGTGATFTSRSASNDAELILDALYPQVRPGARAAVEIAGVLHPVTVTAATMVQVTIDSGSGAKMAATKVTFTPNLSWSSGQSLVFHANPFGLTGPTRPAKTEIAPTDLTASGALVPPVKPLGEAPAGGNVVLVGARKQGVLLSGSIIELGEGAARFQAGLEGAAFDAPLATPVDLFGNVVEAVRGETVIDEVMGSANSAQPFNTFILKKTPLVWREDASQPGGRRPDLTVRVGGIEWTRIDSLFGRGPTEEVYTVRVEPDGGARITFGDGKRGARPPSGVDNIRADYRHGAGAAKPPPGAISQIARPVKGLASVRGPLEAVGGADAETAEELRTTAPAGALTLGRAVSLADFEALARSYAGVQNASAGWIWDEKRQRAAAKLWVMAEGGGLADSLAAWLAGQATPDLIIVVEAAQPAPFSTLSINLEIAERHDPATVRAAARAGLFDPATGLLAPSRQAIGAPLFRSALTHRLHQAPGVASVVAILLDGLPMPHAVAPGVGRWFDLEAGASVI